NAYSYVAILDSFDTHDIGRGRGGTQQALADIAVPTLVVGISSDIIFTPDEMRALADAIPGARYEEIDSEFGHDGFLVEYERLNNILNPFLKE
ncbi:MAG: alpha/beta fold hydrolase, partial [Muribaculaceae bacterium]|nr:alpha/beta fold hydrolase [Muribaculaceae bacterium]